jgi:hypothetical protein
MATEDPQAVIARAQKLMREGKVQEADDLISKYQEARAAQPGAADAPPPPPPPPPEPTWYNYALLAEQLFESVIATLARVFAHVGNPPSGQAAMTALAAQHEALKQVRPKEGMPVPGEK